MAEAEGAEENCCAVCGKVAMTMCGKCKMEKYCGRECQVQHWKSHKALCRKLASANASTPSKASTAPKTALPARTPLCGRGYYQWICAQNGNLKKSGPQYIEKPTVGLQNQENTCYLNAVLQCLIHTTLLRECMTQAYPQPRPEEEWLVELLQLFRDVDEARGSRRAVSASRIASLITTNKEFARGQQADAHEALMLILSRLLDECLSVGDGSGRSLSEAEYATKEQLERSSLVGHVFGMDMGQTVTCDSCSYESTTARVEYCCCLSCTLGMNDSELRALQAELQRGSSSYRSSSQDTSAPDTTLESLMREYMKGEHIDGYKCEKCKRSGCTRAAHVARRPNVLVAYIDRRQDAGLYGKVNRKVRFQQRLDLTPFVRGSGGDWASTSCMYSLYAIVVHRDVNRSTFFGHYVAYVRDKTSQWYLLDDTRVEPVTWSAVQEQHAYLLLYSADQVLPPLSPAAEPSLAQPTLAQPSLAQPRLREVAPTGSAASTGSTRSTAASSASSPRSSSANSTASTLACGSSASAAAEAPTAEPRPPQKAKAPESSEPPTRQSRIAAPLQPPREPPAPEAGLQEPAAPEVVLAPHPRLHEPAAPEVAPAAHQAGLHEPAAPEVAPPSHQAGLHEPTAPEVAPAPHQVGLHEPTAPEVAPVPHQGGLHESAASELAPASVAPTSHQARLHEPATPEAAPAPHQDRHREPTTPEVAPAPHQDRRYEPTAPEVAPAPHQDRHCEPATPEVAPAPHQDRRYEPAAPEVAPAPHQDRHREPARPEVAPAPHQDRRYESAAPEVASAPTGEARLHEPAGPEVVPAPHQARLHAPAAPEVAPASHQARLHEPRAPEVAPASHQARLHEPRAPEVAPASHQARLHEPRAPEVAPAPHQARFRELAAPEVVPARTGEAEPDAEVPSMEEILAQLDLEDAIEQGRESSALPAARSSLKAGTDVAGLSLVDLDAREKDMDGSLELLESRPGSPGSGIFDFDLLDDQEEDAVG